MGLPARPLSSTRGTAPRPGPRQSAPNAAARGGFVTVSGKGLRDLNARTMPRRARGGGHPLRSRPRSGGPAVLATVPARDEDRALPPPPLGRSCQAIARLERESDVSATRSRSTLAQAHHFRSLPSRWPADRRSTELGKELHAASTESAARVAWDDQELVGKAGPSSAAPWPTPGS